MPGNKPKKSEIPAFRVKDDWPDELPITEAELELFETHLLDMITAMVQHG